MSFASMTRKVGLTRDGEHLRVVFDYDEALVDRVRRLPHATWQPNSRSWLVPLSTQTVDELRQMYLEGLVDVSVDSLITDTDTIPTAAPAVLRSGSRGRPYVVKLSYSDDTIYTRLRAISGAVWDKRIKALTYPPVAAAALAEQVDRGVVADPDGVLAKAGVTVTFDGRTGRFVILGDERAQSAFDKHWPERDVVAAWAERQIDVAFSDTFSEEVYRGELARAQGRTLQPEEFSIELFEYQARDLAIIMERSGYCDFASPGLGKTPIGVAAGHERLRRGLVERVLCIVPGSLRSQWMSEIARFTGTPDDQIVVVHGDPKKRHAAYERGLEAPWVIVNYDVLHRDLDHIVPLADGAYVIADEAHRLKNPTAKRTKAGRRIGRRAAGRLALTGTPVEVAPDEWYWVLDWAVPGALGDFDEYRKRYQHEGAFGYVGAKNLAELRARSRAHFSRWRKADVAPWLPPLQVERLLLDPDDRYAAILRRLQKLAAEEIAADRIARGAARDSNPVLDGDVMDAIRAGSEMTAKGMLIAACASPRLLHMSDAPAAVALCETGAVPDVDGPKIDELRTMCIESQNAGERLVVFSGSKRMVELISERLGEDGVRFVTYTGDTSSKDRDAAVAAFTTPGTDDEPGPTVFLATDAAAEGLNLGKCCNTLVNVDIPWTPTRLEQRSNRIHRVDGTRTSYRVVNMTLRNTIEEGVVQAVIARAEIADVLLSESGARERTIGQTVLSAADVIDEALLQWADPS